MDLASILRFVKHLILTFCLRHIQNMDRSYHTGPYPIFVQINLARQRLSIDCNQSMDRWRAGRRQALDCSSLIGWGGSGQVFRGKRRGRGHGNVIDNGTLRTNQVNMVPIMARVTTATIYGGTLLSYGTTKYSIPYRVSSSSNAKQNI